MVSRVIGGPPGKPERAGDSEEPKAREALLELFDANREQVFYSRQLEILLEDDYFHWVTNRVLRELVAEGEVVSEPHLLETGSTLNVVRHKSHRFYKRQALQMVDLVNAYSSHQVAEELGFQGEALVLDGFARNQFVLYGREVNHFRDKKWVGSDHDLDFIFERDGLAYGVEVKNMLGYPEQNEIDLKIEMCEQLGVLPVVAARMLPKDWINNKIVRAGGFALIMKYQMYPKGRIELVRRMRDELGLPADTPRALLDGTMKRFTNWHERNL